MSTPRAVSAAVLALALAATGTQLVGLGAAQAAGVRYVAPVASGTADGSSWANAADLPRLAKMVTAAGSGGQVLLRADAGPYRTESVSLWQGGTTGAPVTIRGARLDGTPLQAVIVGDRADPYSAKGSTGKEVFRLMRGSGHLSFSDLRFENVSTGFRFAGDVTDVSVQHVSAVNVRRFVEDLASGTAPTATVDHLVLRDITVNGYSKGVVRLQYDSNNVLIEDVKGDSEQQDGDNFAMGVHLDGTAHDITMRRVEMDNALDTTHPYWNGDGFAAENQVHHLVFDHTSASGNSDAGYDIKASHVTMNSIVSVDNKKNLRLWGSDVAVNDCALTSPDKRGGSSAQTQLWLSPTAQVVATGCTIADTSPATVVFAVGATSNLTFNGGSVSYQAGAANREGPSTATVLMTGTKTAVLGTVTAPAPAPAKTKAPRVRVRVATAAHPHRGAGL